MTVIPLRRPARIECSACGATRDAACDCGASYVPAGTRAAQALAKNPEKSDRAIAAEIGVSTPTVGRARKATVTKVTVDEPCGTATAPCVVAETRLGKDGKVRRLPQRQPLEKYDEPGVEDDIDGEDPENYRTAYLLRVDQAVRFAAYSGPITKEIVTAARAVAAAWSKLAQKLERSL